MKIEKISERFGLFVYPEDGECLADLGGQWLLDRLISKAGGLILFRGFDVDQSAFVRFTERFGTGFLVHHNSEGRDYVDDDMTMATVAKSNKPIDFHTEMASNPVKPDILWFYCVAPAISKGRVGFVDGRVVLENLTTRTRAVFTANGIKYEFRELPAAIWQPVWRGATREKPTDAAYVLRVLKRFGGRYGVSAPDIDETDRLSFDHMTKAVYRAPLCGEEVFACGLLDNPRRTLWGNGTAVERAILIEVAQATYQNAVWLDWRTNDVAVVDNTRIMHSREAFEDTQRRVLIRYSALRDHL